MVTTNQLIFENLFGHKKSGQILIKFPNADTGSLEAVLKTAPDEAQVGIGSKPNLANPTRSEMRGFLLSEPRIDLKNNWKQLFSTDNAFTTATQVVSGISPATWAGLSAVVWAGSEPLTMSLDIMLVSFNKNSKIESQVKKLMSLGSLGSTSLESTTIHGGYKPDFLHNDEKAFDLAKNGNIVSSGILATTSSMLNISTSSATAVGTIELYLNGGKRIKNLLLDSISYTSSNILVPDGNPMWIKLSVGLRTFRMPYAHEIQEIFESLQASPTEKRLRR